MNRRRSIPLLRRSGRPCWIGLLLAGGTALALAQTPPPAAVQPEVRSVAPSASVAARSRSAAAPTAARRVALVIGNAKYRQLPTLRNPGNDAEDVCAALRALDFATLCRVDIVDRAEFRQLVRQFAAQLGPDTLALFYFAGHAVQLRGDNFLLPTGVTATNQLDLEDDSLALSHVLRVLEEARSAPNIILIDACRDNPFERSGRLSSGRGLARVDPPVGSLLVYATAPGAVAFDGEGRNGLFTKNLLAHLKHPNMPLSELLQQVASDVETEARTVYRYQQVPYRSFSYSGNLCLADCDDQRASAQLAELRRRSDAAMERMRQLEEENARLSQAAGSRPGAVASSSRETELGELRQMLRDYQQRIASLEREAAERAKVRGVERPQNADARSRPVVVPNF